jgi:hypothetical protein
MARRGKSRLQDDLRTFFKSRLGQEFGMGEAIDDLVDEMLWPAGTLLGDYAHFIIAQNEARGEKTDETETTA